MNRTLKLLRASDPNEMVLMEGSQSSDEEDEAKKKDWALEKAERGQAARAKESSRGDTEKEDRGEESNEN